MKLRRIQFLKSKLIPTNGTDFKAFLFLLEISIEIRPN